MKNSNNTIGNRTRGLPICSAVPQPTAPPRGPVLQVFKSILRKYALSELIITIWGQGYIVASLVTGLLAG